MSLHRRLHITAGGTVIAADGAPTTVTATSVMTPTPGPEGSEPGSQPMDNPAQSDQSQPAESLTPSHFGTITFWCFEFFELSGSVGALPDHTSNGTQYSTKPPCTYIPATWLEFTPAGTLIFCLSSADVKACLWIAA